jgi:hypothetical protein
VVGVKFTWKFRELGNMDMIAKEEWLLGGGKQEK